MAIWGSSFSILRHFLADGALPPLSLLSARMTLASVLLGGFLLARKLTRTPVPTFAPTLLRDGAIAGLLLAVGFLLQTEGLTRTTASRSGFFTGLLVVFVPVLEFLIFRKRPALPAFVGILLAFAGMASLAGPLDTGTPTGLGDALTIACAVVFAGHILWLGRVAPRHPVSSLLFLQLAITALVSGVAGWLTEPARIPFGNPSLLAAMIYLSLFATLLAFGVQTWAQTIVTPIRLALLNALEPVFAALWAAALLGERLSGRELSGGALIVLGVVLGEAGTVWASRRAT
jgi:drug/metabolite transporter (DMT)-like permease